MEAIFFNGWAGPVRTLVIGVFGYALLILFLRISGNRTLSKMNAFDFLVTVALGSTLASLLLSKEVSLLQGGVAFALLIGLQFAVTWTSVRWPWLHGAVTGEPVLLVRDGRLLTQAMRRARVTESEVRACAREAGLMELHSIAALVLETDGSFNVIRRSAPERDGQRDTLADVRQSER
jgi:uncharacterized membrane protein YcaP (DUF421 family)